MKPCHEAPRLILSLETGQPIWAIDIVVKAEDQPSAERAVIQLIANLRYVASELEKPLLNGE